MFATLTPLGFAESPSPEGREDSGESAAFQ